MQPTPLFTAFALAFAGFGTALPAHAEASFTTPQLAALITGNTLYVQVPAGTPGAPQGGTAPIYYAADGSAAALLPAGLKLVGTWRLDQDTYCIDWDNGPKNSCTQIARESAGFVLTDATKGTPRGVVTQIQTGNPEKL